MTNKDKLLSWIYKQYPCWAFRTSELKTYAYKNPTNRTDRDARVLREEGILKRLTEPSEKEKYGHFGNEDSYILTDKGKEEAKGLGQLSLFR